jgi:hypothetical protein
MDNIKIERKSEKTNTQSTTNNANVPYITRTERETIV